MIYKIALAAGLGLFLIGAPAARAEPMKCSGEEKLCVADCLKNSNRTTASACVSRCHASASYCMKTGCWTAVTSRYCGLMRQ